MLRNIVMLLAAVVATVSASAATYSYRFSSTPLAQALTMISEEHPEAAINFIYNELESYRTSARVEADTPLEAVRQAVGLNPVAVFERGGAVYAEALQHGVYAYRGRVAETSGAPIEGATVMVLAGRDSSVVTYAVTDDRGAFVIPCDRRDVVAKVSCVGYQTQTLPLTSFAVGTIRLIPLPIRLKGVTVEADDATILADCTVYRPSARQKNSAQDAAGLLRAMAIPQLKVDPSGSVKDNFGEPVAVFINSLPASAEEQTGLRLADVKRVEFLEYPTDPRFQGAKKVVNFIVQEYEYGGYTKLTGSESVLTGLNSDASVYSKFSYRGMTYDLYAGASNTDNRHSGSSVRSDYLLAGPDGGERHVTREERVLHSHRERNSYPVSLRATYATDRLTMRNTVGYTHESTPVNEATGSLAFSDDPTRGFTYDRSNPARANSLSYNGQLQWICSDKSSLTFYPSVSYSHRNDLYSYSAPEVSAVRRYARENSWSWNTPLNWNYTFNGTHSIMAGLWNQGWHWNLSYSGSDNLKQRLGDYVVGAQIRYSLHIKKFSATVGAIYAVVLNDVNGDWSKTSIPGPNVSFNFSLTAKSQIYGSFNLAQRQAGVTARSADVLQSNELMYLTGNPKLKSANQFWANAGYGWYPSNSFSIHAYYRNYSQYNSIRVVYQPYDDGKAVIRNYVNSGTISDNTIGFNATLKLFDGALQLNLAPEQHYYSHTGVDGFRYSPFTCWAGASYYCGNFFINANYYSPTNVVTESANTKVKARDYYTLAAGWGNSSWNVRFTAYNVFNRGWDYDTTIYRGHYYSERSVEVSTYYHPRLNLSVTYTIGYGKKINRGNEVGAQQGASSAIQK